VVAVQLSLLVQAAQQVALELLIKVTQAALEEIEMEFQATLTAVVAVVLALLVLQPETALLVQVATA
jgi:hypothetical protein